MQTKLTYKDLSKDHITLLIDQTWNSETKFEYYRKMKPSSNHNKFSEFVKIDLSREKSILFGQLRSNSDFLNNLLWNKVTEGKKCDHCKTKSRL